MRTGRAALVAAVGNVALGFGGAICMAAPSISLGLYQAPQTSVPLSFTPAPTTTHNLGSFSIVIVPGSGLSGNAAALAAFNRAAATWASRISDPITITVDADLTTTQPGGGTFPVNVIGSTSSLDLQASYNTIRNQMVADANSQPAALNNQIISSLPTAAQFTANLPVGRSLSGNVILSKANAKALGFTGLDAPPASGGFGPSDGTITFNSAFSFDYDNSNGVGGSMIDFETVATHELGHLLGFTSGVDDIDQTTSATYPSVSPTTLDLFRFNTFSNNPTTVANFTTMPRELRPGQTSITDDLTNEYGMSTGLSNGDGNQASHWKADDLTGNYIGIMDPTVAFGAIEHATDADFRSLDLIGYDVAAVPEPTAFGIVAGFGILLINRRRARGIRVVN